MQMVTGIPFLNATPLAVEEETVVQPRYKIDVCSEGAQSSMWGNGTDHMDVLKAELATQRKMNKQPLYIRISEAADNLPSPKVSIL